MNYADFQSLCTPMDLAWCRELDRRPVVTTDYSAPQPTGETSMIDLAMPETRKIVAACLDDKNPTHQADALATRARWLEEIEAKILRPAPGVLAALESLTLPD